MLDRRSLLITTAAASITPFLRVLADPATAQAVAKANALYDNFVQARLQRNPELATSLGLDQGALAPLKSRLQDASLAAVAQEKSDNARRLTALKLVDRGALS